MKNYATPCAFYGTKPELDALIEPLKGFGYRIGSISIYEDGYILVTNFNAAKGILGFAHQDHTKEYNRISAPASNIPLCLALAAMVEGDKIHDGEWLRDYKAIKPIYKARGCFGESTCDIDVFRKATVPEIFAHFGVPFQQIEEKKEEVREIVGYKAPFDIYTHSEKWIIRKGDLMVRDGEGFYYNSDKWPVSGRTLVWSIAKEIVETWEPVYKEVKKIRVEAGEYTKEELQKLIEAK